MLLILPVVLTHHYHSPATECSALGGTSLGSCASGFGVCCTLTGDRHQEAGDCFNVDIGPVMNTQYSEMSTTPTIDYSLLNVPTLCQ